MDNDTKISMVHTMTFLQSQALNKVLDERDRQDEKWSTHRQIKPSIWLAILVEEIGEVAKAMLQQKPYEMRKELVQVCAVSMAWLEAIEEFGAQTSDDFQGGG
jgi:NTP pyrophosphatase (non-canonical NTP hydrolase)